MFLVCSCPRPEVPEDAGRASPGWLEMLPRDLRGHELPPDFLLLGASESVTERMPPQATSVCSGLGPPLWKDSGPEGTVSPPSPPWGSGEEGGTQRRPDSLRSWESPGLSHWLRSPTVTGSQRDEEGTVLQIWLEPVSSGPLWELEIRSLGTSLWTSDLYQWAPCFANRAVRNSRNMWKHVLCWLWVRTSRRNV